jgi:hypothetical protein
MEVRYSPYAAALIDVCNDPAALAEAIPLTAAAPALIGQPQHTPPAAGSFWRQAIIGPALAWLGAAILGGLVADALGWLP